LQPGHHAESKLVKRIRELFTRFQADFCTTIRAVVVKPAVFRAFRAGSSVKLSKLGVNDPE
jgi:hypothetical protein